MLVQVDSNDTQHAYALTQIAAADLLAVDVETSGLNIHTGARLVGVGVATATEEFYFPVDHKVGGSLFDNSTNLHESYLMDLWDTLESSQAPLVFHNAKFDQQWLAADWTRVHDTQLLSYILDENRSHRLVDLGERYFGSDAVAQNKKFAKIKDASIYTAEELAPYGCEDVRLTFKLFNLLYPQLDQQDLEHYRRLLKFAEQLLEVEKHGIPINIANTLDLADRARTAQRNIRVQLGFDPGKEAALIGKLFTPEREGGLGLTPTKKTPTGKICVDESVLKQFDHPTVALVRDYRKFGKRLGTYYEPFINGCTAEQRVHPSFRISSTRTSRLSCGYFHQLPRDSEGSEFNEWNPRRLLVAPEGYVLYELDYSQIELRLAAIYGEAEVLLESFAAGTDPHQATADLLGTTRQTAKHAWYTIVYSGGAKKLAETIAKLEWQSSGRRVTIDEVLPQATEVLEELHAQNPGFREISKKAETVYKTQGYIELWNGRKCHWDGDTKKAYKAFNRLIQGGAAQIMQETMMRQDDTELGSLMLLQVHDSLMYEFPVGRSKELAAAAKYEMEWPGREGFKINFDVDVKEWH